MNLSTDAGRFLFEADFTAEAEPVALRKARAERERIAAEAYAAGEAAGRERGRAEMREELNGQLAACAKKIESQLAGLLEEQARLSGDMVARTGRLAWNLLCRLFPAYTAQAGAVEIEALLTHVIEDMPEVRRITLSAPPALTDQVSALLAGFRDKQAHLHPLVIRSDAQLGPGDCRIAWDNGGIERNASDLLAIIERYLEPGGSHVS
ncbi:MAG TPA: hypothetical protein VHL08_05290 [Dongiaceae bacterium]|jgi:flagellar assembly protein FliH|nr:hypothetical protein [Dongiaceae bacterium]